MQLYELTQVFDTLEQTSGRLEMTRLLAQLFAQSTSHEAEIIAHIALGELYAPYKNVQFNLAEKNVIQAIASFLGISVVNVTDQVKKTGDIGVVISSYTWPHEKHMSVEKAYHLLCVLADISGTKSQEKKS